MHNNNLKKKKEKRERETGNFGIYARLQLLKTTTKKKKKKKKKWREVSIIYGILRGVFILGII